MPFARPTFNEILNRVQADINGRLPGADARLRRSVLNVIAYMLSGVAHGLYGFLQFISLQVFPDSAELEYLRRWGRIWEIPQKPAKKASGKIIVTGNNDAAIPLGRVLQRSDGQSFITTSEGLIREGKATVPVESETAGDKGNTTSRSLLNFVSPPSGIQATATVTDAGLNGGAGVESDPDYLARLLARIQCPLHGGSAADYIAWGLEVPGVTRAWLYPLESGISRVTLRFMMDNSYADGIPLPPDVDHVQAYIEERRPVTAKIQVIAPIAEPVHFEIQLTSNDTPQTRTAVEAELRDLILRDGQPGGTLYLSRINAAISSASGQFDHILFQPTENVRHTLGHIPILGEIAWQLHTTTERH
jgi:uncharacterized phage protein gp47/JayE